MTKIKINQLIWDEWNREHIKKHNVTPQQVEEALLKVVAHKRGYGGRVVFDWKEWRADLIDYLSERKIWHVLCDNGARRR